MVSETHCVCISAPFSIYTVQSLMFQYVRQSVFFPRFCSVNGNTDTIFQLFTRCGSNPLCMQ